MRALLKSSGRWLKVGWFWPLVLLALPNCLLDSGGFPGGPPHAFEPGNEPKSSAIMCGIPKAEFIQNVVCATDAEKDEGIPLAQAAIALRNGVSNIIALDWSPAAVAECGGNPRKIEYYGTFPDGYPACLNCQTQKPQPYIDGNAACVAQCQDLINFGEDPFNGETQTVLEYCQANAKVATNFLKDACYGGACSDGGTPDPNFVDPRRTPEEVVWKDLFGVSDAGSMLTRTAATTGDTAEDYNAGAASGQFIEGGDGWVEFEAGQNGLGHVLGLSSQCLGCADTDPGLTDVHYGLSLNVDDNVYVAESGVLDAGHGPYATDEKYRVAFTDNFDGTASISYYRVLGSCGPGMECSVELLGTHAGSAPYPLRVDASFRQENASVKNVNIVRIQ